jgi:hypothetical protein
MIRNGHGNPITSPQIARNSPKKELAAKRKLKTNEVRGRAVSKK